MREYIVSSASEFHRRFIHDLIADGRWTQANNRTVLALENFRVVLMDTSKSVHFGWDVSRQQEALTRMMEWYTSEKPTVSMIGNLDEFMGHRVWENTPYENYGYVALRTEGVDGQIPFKRVVLELRENMMSQDADVVYITDRWKPVVGHQKFFVDSGKLHSQAWVRESCLTSDFAYDTPWLCSLQARVAEEVGHIPLGNNAQEFRAMYLLEHDVEIAEALYG